MDLLITAAARALAAGDPFGALNRVALRDDAPALALRGIAMAQMGDYDRARALLSRAARAFGPREAVARSRCAIAEAEIALVSRDLSRSPRALDAAEATLRQLGDRVNAAYAGYLAARRLLLLGRIEEAEARLGRIDGVRLPPAPRAACELIVAGIAIRRLDVAAAAAALQRASAVARPAAVPSLIAEIERAQLELTAPAARRIARGAETPLRLGEVATLLASPALVVDACRNAVQRRGRLVALGRRPVLFALARALAEAWPGEATRAALLLAAFHSRQHDESHRTRLRVEIGRLRAELRGLAGIAATPDGFRLRPAAGAEVIVLARPVDEPHGDVLALLADGAAWSSSALALALGTSQRSVQRALEALHAEGKLESFGRSRAKRWRLPSLPDFPTTMLLPQPVVSGIG